jgi:hypothetical protein
VGVGDFLGGLKARALPTLTVLAASQPFGLAALGIAVAALGTGIPGDKVAWSALAAVLGTIGLFAFYRGMATVPSASWRRSPPSRPSSR